MIHRLVEVETQSEVSDGGWEVVDWCVPEKLKFDQRRKEGCHHRNIGVCCEHSESAREGIEEDIGLFTIDV